MDFNICRDTLYGCSGDIRIGRRLTNIEGVHATPKGELIGSDDAGKDSQKGGGEPPTDGVAQEIDLLARIVMSPEGHAAEKERP